MLKVDDIIIDVSAIENSKPIVTINDFKHFIKSMTDYKVSEVFQRILTNFLLAIIEELFLISNFALC